MFGRFRLFVTHIVLFLGLPRVLEYSEYYLSCKPPEQFFYNSSTRYFLFLVENLSFQVGIILQSFDELLKLMETWGFAISFLSCKPGNRYEYIYIGL